MSTQPHWESLGPPPVRLFALEQARALGELTRFRARRSLRRRVPPGDGHPVFVLPGFLAGDYSTLPLRRFLRQLCYDARGWKEGANLGPNPKLIERISARLEQLYQRHERKLSLVGWSLGGIYARELARRHPTRVRAVITLGSPFRDISASHAARLVAMRPGAPPAEVRHAIGRRLRQPVPVPCSSIFSKTDGIVNWRSCLQDEGPERENIEVHCSHTGMGFYPDVLAIVADRLALAEGQWRPYAPVGGEPIA
jgi:pimeloyl-ACP methyl ester carboxylesterase